MGKLRRKKARSGNGVISPYPQRTNTHRLEELSKRYFTRYLPEGWTQESVSPDYGVDLRVVICEEDNVTGLELLVQLKSSRRGTAVDHESVRLKTATYNLLRQKLQLVILVKYVAEEKEAYWVWLNKVPQPDQKKRRFTIQIPKTNRYSCINWSEIQKHVRGITDKKLQATGVY